MIELQHYKELSLKVLLGVEVVFRPGIMLKAPTIKTIAMYSEKHYLELCSYLPKLRELALAQPKDSYILVHQVFAQHPEISIADFYNFLGLFFVDSVDLTYKPAIRLWRGRQSIDIRPTDLAWLFNLIFLISGTFNKQQNEDNPANAQAARILEKIRKAKEKKAKEAAQESNRNPFEIIRSMVELLAVGYNYKISELNELNLFQLMSLGARAQEHEQYNTHLQYSMIPMVDHSKDKPFDHWMQNFRYNIGMDDEPQKQAPTPEQQAADQKPMTVDSIDFTKAMKVTSDMEDEFE